MSSIDYSRFRTLTARQLTQALAQDGFRLVRQRGSHHRYVHPDGRRVTVAYTRNGETFQLRTLRSIVERQAKWTAEDLRRLGLIR